jgi:hypothetical protein
MLSINLVTCGRSAGKVFKSAAAAVAAMVAMPAAPAFAGVREFAETVQKQVDSVAGLVDSVSKTTSEATKAAQVRLPELDCLLDPQPLT